MSHQIEPMSVLTTRDPSQILGMNALVPYAFDQADITPIWEDLIQRVEANPEDAAALVDLSIILQSRGQTDQALQILHNALQIRNTYCVVHGNGHGPRLLAFVTPGDFMANTPLDFLLKGSDVVLWLYYVNADTEALTDLPPHDVAFMAVGESNDNGPVLARMKTLLAEWKGPIMNNDPDLIARLTRDGVSAMLANEPSILAPVNYRFQRIQLEAVSRGLLKFSDLVPGLDFPVIVRPIGTHAGNGMERISDADILADYLSSEPTGELYVAPFIDYRGPDGLFNKQRIVLIKGRAYASHMALSQHWMVHYLSAGMAVSPEKRAVEARWMETFDTDFAVRHAAAFEALYRHIGLDYFGIDSAEMPDGRLLVFELDVAMIVHDMDSAEVYPYKKIAMKKLFDAFVDSVRSTCEMIPA